MPENYHQTRLLSVIIIAFFFLGTNLYAQHKSCQMVKKQAEASIKSAKIALLNKYFEDMPHGLHLACDYRMPLFWCRAHHYQCIGRCNCYELYINQLRALDAKVEEAYQGCVIKNAEIEKAQAEALKTKEAAFTKRKEDDLFGYQSQGKTRLPDKARKESSFTRRTDNSHHKWGFCFYQFTGVPTEETGINDVFYVSKVVDMETLDYQNAKSPICPSCENPAMMVKMYSALQTWFAEKLAKELNITDRYTKTWIYCFTDKFWVYDPEVNEKRSQLGCNTGNEDGCFVNNYDIMAQIRQKYIDGCKEYGRRFIEVK